MRWTKAQSSSHVVATEDGVGRENLDRLCDARIRQVITRLVLYWAEKAFLHVMQIPEFQEENSWRIPSTLPSRENNQ